MKLIPHIRFEDFERRDFEKIASVSILCDKPVEKPRGRPGEVYSPRLSIVRSAGQGELLSPSQVEKLIDALDGAIEDRHQVVADMEGHPPAQDLASSWYQPLRDCLALAEQARDWVGAPESESD